MNTARAITFFLAGTFWASTWWSFAVVTNALGFQKASGLFLLSLFSSIAVMIGCAILILVHWNDKA